MKKVLTWILLIYLFILSSFTMGGELDERSIIQHENEMVKEWITRHLSERSVPFFSFLYEGKKSTSLLL